MLIFTRKKEQDIIINNVIKIKVVGISGDRVRIGIDAPKNVRVDRKEIDDRIKAEAVINKRLACSKETDNANI